MHTTDASNAHTGHGFGVRGNFSYERMASRSGHVTNELRHSCQAIDDYQIFQHHPGDLTPFCETYAGEQLPQLQLNCRTAQLPACSRQSMHVPPLISRQILLGSAQCANAFNTALLIAYACTSQYSCVHTFTPLLLLCMCLQVHGLLTASRTLAHGIWNKLVVYTSAWRWPHCHNIPAHRAGDIACSRDDSCG